PCAAAGPEGSGRRHASRNGSPLQAGMTPVVWRVRGTPQPAPLPPPARLTILRTNREHRLPLHPVIEDWFASKGWAPRQHQRDVLDATAAGASALLIAPTGAGKTLAGFLPTLDDLIAHP